MTLADFRKQEGDLSRPHTHVTERNMAAYIDPNLKEARPVRRGDHTIGADRGIGGTGKYSLHGTHTNLVL